MNHNQFGRIPQPHRDYVDHHGRPTNEAGERLIPGFGPGSPDYVTFAELRLKTNRQLAKGNFTDPPIAELRAELERLAARLTDAGEREDAVITVQEIRDDEAELAKPDTRSPQLLEALEIIDQAELATGTPRERLAQIDAAMDRVGEIAKDTPEGEFAVLRHLSSVAFLAEALRSSIEREDASGDER